MKRKYHSIDSLDNEIYRLQEEGKNISEKLNNNLSYLEDHYALLTINSVFNQVSIGKEKIKEKMKLIKRIF